MQDSESYIDLRPETGRLSTDGVTHLRLMPQDVDMVGVADVFRSVLDGELAVAEGDVYLRDLCESTVFSNGFYHGIAGYRRIVATTGA